MFLQVAETALKARFCSLTLVLPCYQWESIWSMVQPYQISPLAEALPAPSVAKDGPDPNIARPSQLAIAMPPVLHGKVLPVQHLWSHSLAMACTEFSADVAEQGLNESCGWFLEKTVQISWKNAAKPILTNKHQDLTWMVLSGALLVRSFLHSCISKFFNSAPLMIGCSKRLLALRPSSVFWWIDIYWHILIYWI